jgi:hypothetical protein
MIYATNPDSALRTRLLRWATPLWLTLTSVALISHQISLSTLTESVQEQADSVALQLLEERIVDLERSKPETQKDPNTVTQVELNETRGVFKQRLTDMQTAIAGTAAITDLQALEYQLQQLESRFQQTPPSPPPSKPKLRPRKAKQSAEPTFQIIGRELRGGQRFLSISPIGSQSLDQSQIMRIGESFAGWQLRDFDEQTAVFVIDGITHRLNIR